jgi:hypothetical protein
MAVRLAISVPEETWRRLRDMAEQDRIANGRASVCAVVQKIIEQRLSAGEANSNA